MINDGALTPWRIFTPDSRDAPLHVCAESLALFPEDKPKAEEATICC